MRRSGIKVMARLAGLARPLAGYMALAVALGLAGHAAATAVAVLGGAGALAVLDGRAGELGGIFAAMAACAVSRGALRYGEQASNHYIAFRLLAIVRDRVFGAMRRLAPARLEGRDRGDLIALITSDIELLEVFYAHTISPVAIAVLFSAGSTALIASYHPLLGLVAACSYAAVGIGCPLAAARGARAAASRLRARAGELSGLVLESLRGMDEVIQFGTGGTLLGRVDAASRALAADEGALKRAQGRSTGVTAAVILACDLAMLACAAHLHRSGAVGFEGVLVPVLALMSSFGPCVALAGLGATLQPTLAAADRVLGILDERPATPEVAEGPSIGFSGARARGASFSYGAERVLDGADLEVAEGSVVGVTGPSGSGKSTLLRLLMRFWDVGGGAVEVSGTDVRRIRTSALRDVEALVTQETHLFHDSIRANLLIANPAATDAQLEEACRLASVHDFIASLPRGYDTPVGELGDALSGGERQRLGLARAFLSDAPFLLLDEPTSSLDSLNEARVLRSVREGGRGRTVLLVSHRPSTMRVADRVVRVRDGRVS